MMYATSAYAWNVESYVNAKDIVAICRLLKAVIEMGEGDEVKTVKTVKTK